MSFVVSNVGVRWGIGMVACFATIVVSKQHALWWWVFGVIMMFSAALPGKRIYVSFVKRGEDDDH